MSMISLVSTPEPIDNVCLEQAQVKVVWEGTNFGFGTLYITERIVAWISDRSEEGFTLTYPSIGVYGITSSDNQNPDPSLFMVVDLNKTSIPVIQRQPNGEDMDGDIDDGLDEDGSKTATLSLTPEDANSLNLITGLMQQCQLMNPDPDDEQNEDADPNYSFADDTVDQSGDVDADESWFTAETPDNEIRLSDEGRSNLERIVGDLNLDSPHQNKPPSNHQNGHSPNDDEDEMDHA